MLVKNRLTILAFFANIFTFKILIPQNLIISLFYALEISFDLKNGFTAIIYDY
jgi:hypothetical protein